MQFCDKLSYGKSRVQLYKELELVLTDAIALHQKNNPSAANWQTPVLVAKFAALLTFDEKDGAMNVGNAVTNTLKWYIKYTRQNGIHVSPSVVFDGITDNSVSSSWTLDQWKEYLDPKM